MPAARRRRRCHGPATPGYRRRTSGAPAGNVSLGYLSEIERGQKEASSELLAAICEALGARLSELLGEVSDTLSLAEEMDGVLVPADGSAVRKVARDGNVSVSVRQDSPLKATLRATRKPQREVVYAA
jgi:transcriptional regulator with XRE-family HTH domain